MYRPALMAVAVLIAAGCGSSSDVLASAARDVTLARLGQQQSFSEETPISCSKQSVSEGAATTYSCRGAIVSASGQTRQVAMIVVCDAVRKTCIP